MLNRIHVVAHVACSGPTDGVQVDDSVPVVAIGEDPGAFAQQVQVVDLQLFLANLLNSADSFIAAENMVSCDAVACI
jgi:hypothetical protein